MSLSMQFGCSRKRERHVSFIKNFPMRTPPPASSMCEGGDNRSKEEKSGNCPIWKESPRGSEPRGCDLNTADKLIAEGEEEVTVSDG